ncbi:hypothetical protein AL036_08465 [Salipiger aestuarii]|uniref:Uncharacterized protein n=1 Tax=Salipiger aestuarii TaxID=568098 RepID=A0A327YA92_9RHOB|nr:hypothetical protein [Salipiger aestuarii]EIE50785.1 hypothetical protein C357_12204 [Citreicella sp. 357]KAA8607994.1 hypothetical protein AL036_08465 [Salipiger aestuarii]KAA8611387.1 hypothetical protein AL037_09395 [Salipiger aestuarii]KAB2542157.1 hypothetical protein AL035_08840 [Salipiger aestuarii]RAK16705.1 hypothetical protein ATI53_101969 [Salipiger aestuarii]
MHVREITVDGFDGPEPEAMKPGTVSLIADNGRIEIARLAPPRASPWKAALRRRIPDRALPISQYRPGDEELSFDVGLLAVLRSNP